MRQTMPTIHVLPDADQLGVTAAHDIAEALRAALARQPVVRVIFAAAASQRSTLEALSAAPDIDWSRVEAFHMDEYLGLAPDAPQRFALWLGRTFFDRVPLRVAHLITPGDDAQATASAYAAELAAAPIDIVCLGIGQNGHLAFNDPPVADFDDELDVKVVELDHTCRSQQVDDGEFATFDDVPTHAITLTIPRLLRAGELFCMVPGEAKAWAVERALNAPLSEADPATALRTHPAVRLYLDTQSAPQ